MKIELLNKGVSKVRFNTPNYLVGSLKKLSKNALRKYKKELKKYSQEEIDLINKGRKVGVYPFPYVNNKKELEKFLEYESGNQIKTEYVQDKEMKKRESNLVCYSRSSNFPHNNLDLWLKLGKMNTDYLVRGFLLGSDTIQRYTGIPVREIGHNK